MHLLYSVIVNLHSDQNVNGSQTASTLYSGQCVFNMQQNEQQTENQIMPFMELVVPLILPSEQY